MPSTSCAGKVTNGKLQESGMEIAITHSSEMKLPLSHYQEDLPAYEQAHADT